MIEYREMSTLDVPVLVGIEKEVFPESPWSAAQFREELSGVPKSRRYLVAHEAGAIVGYAGIALAGNVADLHNVAVIPSYRKRGIASHLLDELERWAATKKVSALMLEIREGNEEAFPLYKKRGYEVIARRDNYYATGVHALVMRKEIANE
jgi:ribosomal-protein-alanine N-acetyltransferase